VVVDQQTVEAISSSRLRLREITLPVAYGRQGERRKCPAREGKAVTLTARVPQTEHRQRAQMEPTRARAVLTWIELCMVPRKTVTVTPISVERVGEQWHVRLEKGAHVLIDEPRLLRGTPPSAQTCTAILTAGPRKGRVCGRALPDRDYLTDRPITTCVCGAPRPAETIEAHGYTARRMAAMRSEGEAVSEDAQKRFVAQAQLNAQNGYVLQREKLLAAVGELRPYAKTPSAIKHLRSAERQLRALVGEMAPAT
jgi:hypothetical protein